MIWKLIKKVYSDAQKAIAWKKKREWIPQVVIEQMGDELRARIRNGGIQTIMISGMRYGKTALFERVNKDAGLECALDGAPYAKIEHKTITRPTRKEE